jgi:hypothetical protein
MGVVYIFKGVVGAFLFVVAVLGKEKERVRESWETRVIQATRRSPLENMFFYWDALNDASFELSESFELS